MTRNPTTFFPLKYHSCFLFLTLFKTVGRGLATLPSHLWFGSRYHNYRVESVHYVGTLFSLVYGIHHKEPCSEGYHQPPELRLTCLH
jgi:hypothetical protein